jgi:hypothetical protein
MLELFTLKIVTNFSKIWVRDPRSEIRDPVKTYSGSRIQWSKRHRIPDPDPQHCIYVGSGSKSGSSTGIVRHSGSGSAKAKRYANCGSGFITLILKGFYAAQI